MANAREIMKRMADKEREIRSRRFLAPFTPKSKTAIVKMDGINYKFRIIGHAGSGIGIFEPVDPTCAKFAGIADIQQSRKYLDILPRIHLILCYETDDGWVAYPMNSESAMRTLGLQSEVIVRNVTDCERFDVVSARYDGMHFWYDDIFGINPIKSHEMRTCFAPNLTVQNMRNQFGNVKGVSPEDRRAFDLALMSWTQFQKVTTEARLRDVLANSGATLASYVVRGVNIEVKWRTGTGNSYVSVVNKESLDVVSAGICLSGGDHLFHLKDLPYVMEDGEKRNLIRRVARNDMEDYD